MLFNINKISKLYDESKNYNIFRNYIDASLAVPVLFIVPLISIFVVIFSNSNGFIKYGFPLLSICFAGIYDAYGRYELDSPKNIKLSIRVVADILTIILVLLFESLESSYLLIIPPLCLIISGFIIVREIANRIITAVCLSKWYSRLSRRD